MKDRLKEQILQFFVLLMIGKQQSNYARDDNDVGGDWRQESTVGFNFG